MSPEWNPQTYLNFEAERLRPARDLIAALPEISCKRLVDLGCGAGNVTPLLAARFPQAGIEGVDNSQAMLDKARAEDPDTVTWTQADIAQWVDHAKPADLIISNATLHWLAGHDGLFPRLLNAVVPGGVLAVQMPDNFTAPSHQIILRVLEEMDLDYRPHWAIPPVAKLEDYYDLLAADCRSIDLWETRYMHRLRGKTPVRDFVSGSALRPVLNAIPEELHDDFVARLDARYAAAYPKRDDGAILFPFRRVFLVARRA